MGLDGFALNVGGKHIQYLKKQTDANGFFFVLLRSNTTLCAADIQLHVRLHKR
jgi:hypothetical protein